MEYLLLGKIIKPHGLKGEVKIFSHTDFASLRYQEGHVVFYLEKGEYKPLTVRSFFKKEPFDVVGFIGHNDPASTDELIGKNVYILKKDAKLPEGYIHYSDLVGCKILADKKEIGEVIEVLDYPANYCLKCISKDKKNFVIPYVNEFILSVNTITKIIEVKLIEGIL